MPLGAVLVTNGDIDHVAGLLTLREVQPFTLFATAGIHDVLAANPMLDALNPAVVDRETIAGAKAIAITTAAMTQSATAEARVVLATR